MGSIKNWPRIVLCCLGGVRGTGQQFENSQKFKETDYVRG